ncbi:MAG: hypothetical protein ACYSWQ_21285, partial [Planctomycetota bacterium]
MNKNSSIARNGADNRGRMDRLDEMPVHLSVAVRLFKGRCRMKHFVLRMVIVAVVAGCQKANVPVTP